MANQDKTILIKQNSTSGIIPSPSELMNGEIALNTADAVLYTKKTDGTIVSIGSGAGGSSLVQSVAGKIGSVVLTKEDVGLSNVDNTSDANKPISTAIQTALNLKAPINNPIFTGTVNGITKAMVGLGNVDNTSDSNKPISTATQEALNLKAPINNPSFTGTVSGVTKTMVGLGNANNTSDADKPISTATQTALNLKAPINNPTLTGTVNIGTTNPWIFNTDTGVLNLPEGKPINWGQNIDTLGPPVAGGGTDRVRLWDFEGSGSNFNYAIGAEGNHVWFAMDVNNGTGGFKFYSRDTEIFKISDDSKLMFPNGTTIAPGTYDNSTGGNNGISFNCAVGYQLNWQGGRLRSTLIGGDSTPQTIYADSPISFSDDNGSTVIDATGLSFPDGTSQTTAYIVNHSHSDNGFNTRIGQNSLSSNTTGDRNTSIGFDAMVDNIIGQNNTAVGSPALWKNLASNNTAIGAYSMVFNTTGELNTAIGSASMSSNVNGYNNCAIGAGSLYSTTTGINNVAIGTYSSTNNTTGSNNTFIGFGTSNSSNNLNNCIVIGANAQAINSGEFALGSSVYPINTGSTVGTAGSASALPALPLGYLSIRLNGTLVKLPYYRA